MLPASLFAPLDLPAAVEEARRTRGANGVVDLLVVTLTDRGVRSDADIDQHVETLLAACRQTRRYREAIPVLERVAALNPERKPEVEAELALVHCQLGEHARAMSLLEAAVTQQQRMPAWRRSLAFSLIAEQVAMQLRHSGLAQECAALGRSTATTQPARARRGSTAERSERTAADPSAERSAGTPRRRSGLARPVLAEPSLAEAATGLTTAAPRAERSAAPRRRSGLARPVLSAEPMLTDLDPETPATRPLLTLIAGSAA